MRETFAIFYLALTRPFEAPSPRGGLILHYGYWPAKQKFLKIFQKYKTEQTRTTPYRQKQTRKEVFTNAKSLWFSILSDNDPLSGDLRHQGPEKSGQII